MITEEELAEIVFVNGLELGIEYDRIGGAKMVMDGHMWLHPQYNEDTSDKYIMKNFIFSWPHPCRFGLVVDAAEKLGWTWDYRGGWFSFYTWGKGLVEGHVTTKYEWDKKNPMMAICLAFREVLEKEGKL